MTTSETRKSAITRKVRIWPEVSTARIDLPSPPTGLNPANPLMLITLLCSSIGMLLYATFMSTTFKGGGVFVLGMLFMSGAMLLGTLLNFFLQWFPARKRKRQAHERFQAQLDEAEAHLEHLARQEQRGRFELDPPFIAESDKSGSGSQTEPFHVKPVTQRRCNNDDLTLWSRRPDDPDFLSLRIGVGPLPPHFTVHAPGTGYTDLQQEPSLATLLKRADGLPKRYATLRLPITVNPGEQGTLAILGSGRRLIRARALAQAMIAHLAYHHSPDDVRVIILAPERQRAAWDWASMLPHTVLYDPRQTVEPAESNSSTLRSVAIGNEAVLQQLPLISREVNRRELLLGDFRLSSLQGPDRVPPLLPRLVIVVDHFDEDGDLDPPTIHLAAIDPQQSASLNELNRPRLTISPLRRAEMTLALNTASVSQTKSNRSVDGTLGVCVIAICQRSSDVPSSTGQLIELVGSGSDEKGGERLQAHIRALRPDAPPRLICERVDEIPHDILRQFAMRLQTLRPLATRRPELRTQVDFCALFEPPLDLAQYDPRMYWNGPTACTVGSLPALSIPIGMKIGDEVQYLDLLKDGPHGLLIGQTGSGKSELLQTIIAALAVSYRPEEVNFLLIDYKAGLALEPFSRLPHTIGFLSNVSSPALIQRFITMLRAEALRREICLKEGRTIPRLVIIIDEFAEMVKRTENVLDELFTITRVGREIGMHLLLAAQRPEGIIGSRVRDYVQYRLCLRCASPEDSREVLRRVDAASLPASIPGRGYLLHGDNQLDLFQAARVSLPVNPSILRHPSQPVGVIFANSSI